MSFAADTPFVMKQLEEEVRRSQTALLDLGSAAEQLDTNRELTPEKGHQRRGRSPVRAVSPVEHRRLTSPERVQQAREEHARRQKELEEREQKVHEVCGGWPFDSNSLRPLTLLLWTFFVVCGLLFVCIQPLSLVSCSCPLFLDLSHVYVCICMYVSDGMNVCMYACV